MGCDNFIVMSYLDEKVKFETPVEAPGELEATDREYHDRYPDYSELYLVERNPWTVQPRDKAAEEHLRAAFEAIREGDTLTARAMANRVLDADQHNFFARTILIEAMDLGSD